MPRDSPSYKQLLSHYGQFGHFARRSAHSATDTIEHTMNNACDAHDKSSSKIIACAIRRQCCNSSILRRSCNPPQQLPYNPPCRRLSHNFLTESYPPTRQRHRLHSRQRPPILNFPSGESTPIPPFPSAAYNLHTFPPC